jgi:hypothetical protein
MPNQPRHDMGVGGYCICPKCDTRMEHTDGIPCQDEKCPACGAKMLREGSHHHKLFIEKQKSKNKTK